MEVWEINGVTLEYIDETHTYIADGVIVPSITQILQVKFGNKYNGISRATLDNAARKGTALHRAIEELCTTGEVEKTLKVLYHKEIKNFSFLQRKYGFSVVNNEVPVILFKDNEPIAAGRLDLVLCQTDELIHYGLADIKRTATLDKEYLAYQLNLYRIAYMQRYGTDIDFLKGIHLRDDTRKYVDIPINEAAAWELVDLYFKEVNND